jgi:mono/diheme cytochrome c family protein
MTGNRPLLAVTALALLYGCASETKMEAPAVEVREAMPLQTGKAQFDRLCGRGRSDIVLDAFCQGPTNLESLVNLRAALGLGSNENLIDHGFALTSHSTSLSMRSVSSINPRIIFVQPLTMTREFVSLAFTRGEQFAEMVVRDRATEELQFYLLTYKQACNDMPQGCSFGDLLTEEVETGWQDVNVYAEEDIENTPLDCRVCHQPDGPDSPKLLRMQELEPPWNHWLWRQAIGGRAVLDDYKAAKMGEMFGGVPGDKVLLSQPGLLSFALHSVGSENQPNAFVSATIEQEVMESAAAAGGNQPTDNSIPGTSPTWQAIYETAKRGEAINVPYHDVKITDAQKLAQMTEAYSDYRDGALDRQLLPDIRDVYLDDPMRRAEMGFETEPGLDGKGVLLQACGQCHNDRLDKTLSRSRFNVDLSKLGRGEKDLAIARIKLDRSAPQAMPPVRFRALSEEGRERLIELLEQ